MDIYRELTRYCQNKNPTMCWFDYPPAYLFSKEISFKDIKKSVKSLILSDDNCGLYVNIPFCESRCAYCIYYSDIYKGGRKFNNYLAALEKEIKLYQIGFKKRQLKHLYIGGGTPLLLSPTQLKRLFKIIYGNFSFTDDSLFIIESRPEDYTREKLRILVENKINRATIGVQSLNKDTIRRMGRKYDVNSVEVAVKRIRKSGIKYINVDIIVGLPGEGIREHKKTITGLLKINPDAISCYSMLYGKRVSIADNQRVPEKKVEQYFDYFDNAFRKNNYPPIIEKKCFYNYFYIYLKDGNLAADNKMLNDNLNNNAYILGIGSGSMSYLPDIRYSIDGVPPYIRRISNNASPKYLGVFMGKDDIMRQYVILQLYLYKELKLSEFKEKFQVGLIESYKKELKGLIEDGMIKRNNTKIILSDKINNHDSFLYSMLKHMFRRDYFNQMVGMAGINKEQTR